MSCTAALCNTLQYTAIHCNTLHHIATDCNTLQHTATHCNRLQHTAHCNTQRHIATHCNTLQHIATYCNTLQHTATHCNTLLLRYRIFVKEQWLSYVATCGNVLQFVAVCGSCSVLQWVEQWLSYVATHDHNCDVCVSDTYILKLGRVALYIEMSWDECYCVLHLECHLFVWMYVWVQPIAFAVSLTSISDLNLIGLCSAEGGNRDLDHWLRIEIEEMTLKDAKWRSMTLNDAQWRSMTLQMLQAALQKGTSLKTYISEDRHLWRHVCETLCETLALSYPFQRLSHISQCCWHISEYRWYIFVEIYARLLHSLMHFNSFRIHLNAVETFLREMHV